MTTDVILTIKTSQGNSAPSSLANGELAYSYASNKLYVGQTTAADDPVTVEYIGGKLLVDKVANLESILFSGTANLNYQTLGVAGTLTLSGTAANKVLITKSGGVVEGAGGTDGQLFQIAANGTPYFDSLNGGTF